MVGRSQAAYTKLLEIWSEDIQAVWLSPLKHQLYTLLWNLLMLLKYPQSWKHEYFARHHAADCHGRERLGITKWTKDVSTMTVSSLRSDVFWHLRPFQTLTSARKTIHRGQISSTCPLPRANRANRANPNAFFTFQVMDFTPRFSRTSAWRYLGGWSYLWHTELDKGWSHLFNF